MVRVLKSSPCRCSLIISIAQSNVYVSRFWHNHQPTYWPEWNGTGENSRVQYAWDSIVLKGGQDYGSGANHPENDLVEIFGKSDRVQAYQSGPRNSLAGIPNEAGFAMSYSGSLIDNVRNLGANNQLGPSPTDGWWFNEPNPGQAAWNVAPFAYQLHKAKYVNPETGAEKSLILVPSDDAQSYVAGYSGAQKGMIDSNIAPFATDSTRPVIVLPSTDGDNAWGGGSSSHFESTPSFFNDCKNGGYKVTAIQDFVNLHEGAANTIHVEDGAWIFPESDYGSPYFLKWIEPPVGASGSTTKYPGTVVDLESPGFALKFWAWAPIITGANWVETAEQILRDEGGSVEAWKIQAPYDWDGTWTSPNDVERAWHIYLAGLDSGFNYYGGLGNDDEVKPSLATRRAIELLTAWMTSTRRDNDRTPPSVLRPQRFPWNPGAYTFGWFNSIPGGDTRYLKKMPSEFYVWTHAYDLSGVQTISLKVRIDVDGTNPLDTNQNETYAGGSDVGSWIDIPMVKRVLPKTQSELNAAASNGQIDYFITPPELADYYFAKITNSNVTGFRGKLLDYYIESADSKGNVSKSEIQHVFVADDGAVNTVPATPAGVSANGISSNQVEVSWSAVVDATEYVVRRGGVVIATVTDTAYSDTNLAIATGYTYTVAAVNSADTSIDSSPAGATTLAPPQDYTMDGAIDFSGYLVTNPGMTIYTTIRGSRLYVSTWSPGNEGGLNDHFIFVTDSVLATASALPPWGKGGMVAVDASKPYLAGESINSYAGWANAPASSEVAKAADSSGQLEGSIDLAEAFGTVPPVVYVAAVAYQTGNTGGLASQAPAGNANANLEPNEFFEIPVAAIRDRKANGVFDRLDPERDFVILGVNNGDLGAEITFPVVPGRSYRVLASGTLHSESWTEIGTVNGLSGDDEVVITDSASIGTLQRFYRIELLPFP